MGEITPRDEAQRIHNPGDLIQIGQWYWVKEEGEKASVFYCVVAIGSNFVELEGPGDIKDSLYHTRIHLDHFDETCKLEKNPEAVIRGRVEMHQGEVRHKLAEIRKVTERLGVSPQTTSEPRKEEATRALSVLSGEVDIKKYKRNLIRAKDKELPKLFEEVKKANEAVASWMQAQTLPMKGMVNGMQGIIGEINDRVFNVSIYAGLAEEVKQITEGAPAGAGERLRIFQRLLYMDEECLLGYQHGGLDFRKISQFDEWLAKPGNLNRALPFPKSMVAFRVRREEKERDWGGSLSQLLINIQLGELDKATFLYIRNGERLYRMNCDLDFGELIFPSKDEFNIDEPMMAKMFCSRVEEVITKRAYDDIVAKQKELKRLNGEWEKANPKKSWIERPHSDDWFHDSYQPFNKSSVYYDDIKKTVDDRIKYYNRIALIVQGLYDRSEILHPHPPVHLWRQGGFEAAVELIADGAMVLNYKEAPSFEVYQAMKNKSLKVGAVTIGQEDCFEVREANKENRRLDNSWRNRSTYRHTRFTPYGNPGPGYLAKINAWNRKSRKATYRWTRERQVETWNHPYQSLINASIEVPATRLFNVDSYIPGEYKIFFLDPRTRAQYLKWAPMLLAAEEYHAGNLKVGEKKRGS